MALKFLRLAKSMAESHPFIWALAWEAIFRMPFLLPHDRSYLALRHFIRGETGLFLDIGANNGISAMSFRRICKTYAILSLEPNSLHKGKLEIVKRNDPLFDFRLIGAGSEAGEICFYTPIYRGIALHTFTSSDQQQIRTAVKVSFGSRVADRIHMTEIRARVLPIDSLGISPSIIKIDAEGFDLAVLEGAPATIERCRPYIMVEVVHTGLDDFFGFFADRRYTFLAYDDVTDRFNRMTPDSSPHDLSSRNIFVVPDEAVEKLPTE